MKINYLIIGIFLISCNNEPIIEEAKDLTTYRAIEEIISIPNNFIPGIILSIKKIKEKEYIFVDFSHRMLFHLDLNSNEVYPIGGHGSGPGEYRNPLHFQKIGENAIAFTEISNMSIKFLELNGNFINQIDHGLGGGRQFVVNNSKNEIYIQGNLNGENQLTVFDINGNLKEEMFPVKEEYENQVKNFGGGGIVQIEDSIYLMNGIEPSIYVYNTETKKSKEVNPFKGEMFSLNDGVSLMNYNADELRSVYNDVVIFNGLYEMNINDINYLIVYAKKGGEFFVLFLNSNLNLEYYYTSNNTIIGIDKKGFIYERDVESESKKIEKISLSIK